MKLASDEEKVGGKDSGRMYKHTIIYAVNTFLSRAGIMSNISKCLVYAKDAK